MTWLPLYGSTIVVDQVARNPSREVIYPVWEITGPAYYPILTNVTTGKYFALPAEIRYGEVYHLDFSPSNLTYTSSYGLGVPVPAAGSEPWSLALGDNLVRIELGRATAATRVRLTRVPTVL